MVIVIYPTSLIQKDDPLLMKIFLKEVIKLDPHQSSRDLAQNLNVSYSNVQEHHKRIGKNNKNGFGAAYEL